MYKRRYQFDEAKTQRYLAQGRGTGDGINYRSWLKVNDVPSMGRSHRLFGIKTHRVHHLLSDGEHRSCLHFESDGTVIDIREGFPLDRHQTSIVARDLGYEHPATTDGTPLELTLDFLITRLGATALELEPYYFKPDPGLLSKRDWQLFAIAAECTRRNGLTLKFIDATFFNPNLVKNYDAIRSFYDVSNLEGYDSASVRRLASAILSRIADCSDETLASMCRSVGDLAQVSANKVFGVTKHLFANALLAADLSQYSDLTLLPLNRIVMRRGVPCR